MFDWVGDAIDWIGDGISSLWDNTVGVVTSEAARVIFDMMFDWLFMLIYDGIAALLAIVRLRLSLQTSREVVSCCVR